MCEQEDDQTEDVQKECYNHLFYENCNHPVINFVSDDSKEIFSLPIYNKCEEDYLDDVPKKTVVDFVSLVPVSEENIITIQGERDENKEDSECVESDCLPLCYSSFELLRHMLKISKHK